MKRIFIIAIVLASCSAPRPLTMNVTRVDTTGKKYTVTAYAGQKKYVATFDTLPADLYVGARFTANRSLKPCDTVFTSTRRRR